MRTFVRGFTLAELLISLAILGVIATFTIPKILSAQQSAGNNAKAKEVAAMIAGAFQKAQSDGTLNSGTVPANLSPYMNYIGTDTSTVIDAVPGHSSTTCTPAKPCLKLHNGGYLWFHMYSFGGTTSLNALDFVFDPDPLNNTTSTADGPLKAVQFNLYYDGFLTSRGKAKVGSVNSGGAFILDPNYDPSWFNW